MSRFDDASLAIRKYYENGETPTASQLSDIAVKYDIDTIGIVLYNEIERRRSLGAVDPSLPMDHPVNKNV